MFFKFLRNKIEEIEGIEIISLHLGQLRVASENEFWKHGVEYDWVLAAFS